MTTALYLHYDQEALDRQLNLRAKWPEHQTYFDRWAESSRIVLESPPAMRDFAYGEDASEKIDLFLPQTTAAKHPLVIFIHGGYWQSLDKTDFAYLAPPFLDRGVAFASVNYELAPEAPIEKMVQQCRQAVIALRRAAADFSFDLDRILICGHSAGGHLATATFLTDWRALDSSLPAQPFCAGCSISGLYELEPVRLSYHNEILDLSPEEVVRVSPLRFSLLPEQLTSATPFLCAVGAEETDEFIRQQRVFQEHARQEGWDIAAMKCSGLNHFSVIDALGDAAHPLFGAVFDLVSRD